MATLQPPQPARLSKRGSLTPSIRRLLSRYPPAIIEDDQLSSTTNSNSTRQTLPPLTEFDRRFPQGYKIADPSIPLHPDEVPPGSELIFNPAYSPICRTVLSPSLPHPPLPFPSSFAFHFESIS